MANPLIVLDTMPSPTDFYGLYWNRRPFVVRGAIDGGDMAALIAADELAGLSMEEMPVSRMVMAAADKQDWSCRFGPFTEEDFSAAGETGWSLLVQNVEQFHTDTADLLRHFNFAPRWLMDDIMVSFSAKGGSVGAHIDSYHVFLVQGAGTRCWKVGREAIREEVYIAGIDLKVLADDFVGDEIEVTCGDVLYIPPKFAHEGITLEDALTFSVGFLGPKFSELMSGYSQYLAADEALDHRYVGEGIETDSAGFEMNLSAVEVVRDSLVGRLNSQDFTQWLVSYFTESSHEDLGVYTEREDQLSLDAFEGELQGGAGLVKPEYVKFVLTTDATNTFYLGFDGQSFTFSEGFFRVIQKLMKGEQVSRVEDPALFVHPATAAFLLELYNHQALEFT